MCTYKKNHDVTVVPLTRGTARVGSKWYVINTRLFIRDMGSSIKDVLAKTDFLDTPPAYNIAPKNVRNTIYCNPDGGWGVAVLDSDTDSETQFVSLVYIRMMADTPVRGRPHWFTPQFNWIMSSLSV